MEHWYVIQVMSGHEEKVVQQCQILVNQHVLKECFIPYVKTMKKMQGKWQQIQTILFKGYVFLISDDVDSLFQELKKVPELTKLIGRKKTEIYPLLEKEVFFLKQFGKEKHLVEMSVGYIEGDKIRVTEGPLMGREAMIKKIDRHKRIAYIEVDFFNQVTVTKVGLEIIRKDK